MAEERAGRAAVHRLNAQSMDRTEANTGTREVSDRLRFDAATPAGGLARPVADSTQNAGENVRSTVDQVGGRELPLRNQADIFGNVRVSGARPLAIDDAMIIVRICSIGWLHRYLAPYQRRHCAETLPAR